MQSMTSSLAIINLVYYFSNFVISQIDRDCCYYAFYEIGEMYVNHVFYKTIGNRDFLT